MSDVPPMYECLVWDHTDPVSTRRVLDWIETQPRKATVGYIQIGQQSPIKITHKNRHTWQKILFDCDQELTHFCEKCGQEMLEDEYSTSDLICDTCVGERDRGSSKWEPLVDKWAGKDVYDNKMCRYGVVQKMPPATGVSYYKDIEQNEDVTKWYDCPHCDAGYPDQKCICKENEE